MIDIEQLEPGIVCYHWRGVVSMVEARAAVDRIKEIVREEPYAALVNMADLERAPNDFANMRLAIAAEVRNGLLGYSVYGASRLIETLIRPLSLLAPTTYHFSRTRAEAMESAREMLVNAREPVSG